MMGSKPFMSCPERALTAHSRGHSTYILAGGPGGPATGQRPLGGGLVTKTARKPSRTTKQLPLCPWRTAGQLSVRFTTPSFALPCGAHKHAPLPARFRTGFRPLPARFRQDRKTPLWASATGTCKGELGTRGRCGDAEGSGPFSGFFARLLDSRCRQSADEGRKSAQWEQFQLASLSNSRPAAVATETLRGDCFWSKGDLCCALLLLFFFIYI